jgi:hypothetical protein
MTLVVINKTAAAMPMQIRLKGFEAAKVRGYSVTADSLSSPSPAAASLGGGGLSFQAPPLSVSSFELSR